MFKTYSPRYYKLIISTIYLGMPRPPSFIEPSRDDLFHETFELRALEEMNMNPVREKLLQWPESIDG